MAINLVVSAGEQQGLGCTSLIKMLKRHRRCVAGDAAAQGSTAAQLRFDTHGVISQRLFAGLKTIQVSVGRSCSW